MVSMPIPTVLIVIVHVLLGVGSSCVTLSPFVCTFLLCKDFCENNAVSQDEKGVGPDQIRSDYL